VEHLTRYLPWLVGTACICLLTMARLLTNHYIKRRYQEILINGLMAGYVPQWVSTIFLIGFIGLIVCGFWSFTIAWWAPLLPLVAYFLQMVLVPSKILKIVQDLQFGPHKHCAVCGKLRPPYDYAIDENQPDRHSVNCEPCRIKAPLRERKPVNMS
jgi:hypothetical protein